jgi:hypothetical protein
MGENFVAQNFDYILLIGLGAYILVFLVAFIVFYKKGVDVTRPRFIVSLSLSCVFMFIAPPIWFTGIPLIYKIIATIFGPMGAVANYLAINRIGHVLRRNLMDDRESQDGEERKNE